MKDKYNDGLKDSGVENFFNSISNILSKEQGEFLFQKFFSLYKRLYTIENQCKFLFLEVKILQNILTANLIIFFSNLILITPLQGRIINET